MWSEFPSSAAELGAELKSSELQYFSLGTTGVSLSKALHSFTFIYVWSHPQTKEKPCDKCLWEEPVQMLPAHPGKVYYHMYPACWTAS